MFQDTNLRLWVVDVATGKATDIGGDEFMVPERSLNPTWSPDSRWIAYVRRLKSLYRAIFVYDMTTGQTHQITDGLADATCAGVGRERQVSLVLRVHRPRTRLRLVGHVELRTHGDQGALLGRVVQERSIAIVAGER